MPAEIGNLHPLPVVVGGLKGTYSRGTVGDALINIRLRTASLRESSDELVGDEHFCSPVAHLYELTQVGRQQVGMVVGRYRFEFLSLAGHQRGGTEARFQKHHVAPPILRPFGNVIAAPEAVVNGDPGGISLLGLGKKSYIVKSIMIRVICEGIVLGSPSPAQATSVIGSSVTKITGPAAWVGYFAGG